MVAQEALTDKVTCEQKPEGDEGGDHAISGVKTTTNRENSRFKDSEVGARLTSAQPKGDIPHQLGMAP